MPVDWSKCPKNWKEIAHQVKEDAGWCCEECDRPCRSPGQSWREFFDWLEFESLFEGIWDGDRNHPQKFTLTVAHLDHDTNNSDRGNLQAKCSGCQAKNAAATRRKKAQQSGQLMLLEVLD